MRENGTTKKNVEGMSEWIRVNGCSLMMSSIWGEWRGDYCLIWE